jgi:ATP-dependent helicase/nuclease subunit B
MKKVKVKIFSTRDKTYEIIAEELERLNKENPFGYYFIGASSDVVLQAANYMVKKGTAYIRSNFFAIDEFIVNIFKQLRSGYTFLTPNQEYVLIKSLLKNSKDERYKKFARSKTIIEESIELLSEINKNLVFKDWDSIQKGLNGIKFLKYINDNLFAREKIIDKSYVYNYFIAGDSKEHDYIEDDELSSILKDKTLVFYGFLDIPDALNEILKRLIDSSKESIFYSIYQNNPMFENTRKYLSGLCGFFNFGEEKELDIPQNIEINEFTDENLEQDSICFEIKKLLFQGKKPEDIGVVVQNSTRAKNLASKMEEYLIPYRIKSNVPLIKSKAINSILLPFLIETRGYKPEDIVSYMELRGNDQIRDVYIKSKINYGYTNSLKNAKKIWTNSIKKYISFLEKKKSLIIDDEFNQKSKIEKEIEILQKTSKDIKKSFKELEKYSKANENITEFRELISKDISDYMKSLHSDKHITEKSDINNASEEIRALKKFERIVNSLIKTISSYDEDNKIPYKISSIVKDLCKKETYIPAEFFNNTVEILSLDSARYTPKKYLFISSFVSGEYPNSKFRILGDKEYYREVYNKDLFSKEYKQTELALYLSILECKKVYFSYFKEDKQGKPFVASVLLDKFAKNHTIKKENINRLLNIANSLNKQHALSLAFIKNSYPKLLKNKIENIKNTVGRFLNKPKEIESYEFDENKIFSFSQFSNYIECPYKYFISYLLKLSKKEELSLGVSALDEGNLMHKALEEFFTKYKGKRLQDLEGQKEELIQELKSTISEKFDEYIYSPSKRYFKITKNKIISYSEKIIETETKSNRNKVGIVSELEKPFDALSVGGVKFKGRIDRFDRETKNNLDVVFDYKPKTPGGDLKKYQLIIYLMYYKNREGNLGTSFYSYKTGSISNYIKLEDSDIIFAKNNKKSLKEIEEIFKSFKQSFKQKKFNIKANNIGEADKPFNYFDLKRDPFDEYGICSYCPLKDYCDRGEIL